MASTVETHPQFEQIKEWLASGMDAATVAAQVQPALHRTTIWRYWRNQQDIAKKALHLPSLVVSSLEQRGCLKPDADSKAIAQTIAQAAQLQLSADPYLTRIEQLRADRQKVKELALTGEKPDLKAWATLDRNDLSEIELHARFTGRLDNRPTTGDVNLAVLVGIPRGSATDDKPEVRQLAPGDVSFSDPE